MTAKRDGYIFSRSLRGTKATSLISSPSRYAKTENYGVLKYIKGMKLDMKDEDIIENYKGLWKIDEIFKITKTCLKSRPVCVKTDAHIEAHFPTCFISLLILRIIEMKTKRQFSSEKIIESLNKANVAVLTQNIYQGLYYDEILKELDDTLETNLALEYPTLSDIKKLISDTK